MRLLLTIVFLMLHLPPAAAQSVPHVFQGAMLIPVSHAPIENGTLVIEDGTIAAIGGPDLPVPVDAVVYDVSGRVIMPGLVDTHSHIGGADGGDRSSALHPDIRTLDALDVRHSSLQRARAGGITTVNVMPGSGHLMSGQTTYIKLRHGRIIDDLLFCDDPIEDVCGGMKMANGTNAIRSEPGSFPGTRSRSAAMVREQFVAAQNYRDRVQRAHGDPEKLPARDLRMEGLLQVLDGSRVVHFHTHRHDDILTALRLQKEFGFRLVLQHVSEAWKVADEIAAAGIPASIIVLDAPGGKFETVDIRPENGAALERAGAAFGYHTDDYITDSRLFLRSAGLAVRAGLSRERALEAMTLAGARMLDLEHRIGSLEVGKDADFIVLSGDPLSVYTRVEETWVEGSKVFDFSDPEQRQFATGGDGAFTDPGSMHIHLHD